MCPTKSDFTSISAILGRPGRSVRAGPIWLKNKRDSTDTVKSTRFSGNPNPWQVRCLLHWQNDHRSPKIIRKRALQSQCREDPRNWNREIYQNHQKFSKVPKISTIWARLWQIDQESLKYSRTHALGSNTEMSARDVVKADEIEHRNTQNAQSGGSWTSTFIHLENEFSIINIRTAAKGSILDIKEGPHVNFQGSSPSS